MNSGSLEDRILIREVYGQYAYGGSFGDTESWLATWDEDGHWVTVQFDRRGKVEIREQWHELVENFDGVVVLNEVGPIEVSGDRAKAYCGVLEILQIKDAGTAKAAGIYHDEFIKRDGTWRFLSRNYTLVSYEMG